MNNVLAYGWIICFIVSYLIQVIIPMSVGDNSNDTVDRSLVFLEFIAWILSIIGLILFIIWLIRFNDTKVLNTMWIVSLITFIVSIGIVIFMTGNVPDKILYIPTFSIGYSFTIFIGSLITFLVKK